MKGSDRLGRRDARSVFRRIVSDLLTCWQAMAPTDDRTGCRSFSTVSDRRHHTTADDERNPILLAARDGLGLSWHGAVVPAFGSILHTDSDGCSDRMSAAKYSAHLGYVNGGTAAPGGQGLGSSPGLGFPPGSDNVHSSLDFH